MYRNYNEEMREAIKEAVPEWAYVPSIVAQNLVDKLERENPQLLFGWLQGLAVQLLAKTIEETVQQKAGVPIHERFDKE